MDTKKANDDRPSNRDEGLAESELFDSLLEGSQSEQDLFGPAGVLTKLKVAAPQVAGRPCSGLLAFPWHTLSREGSS